LTGARESGGRSEGAGSRGGAGTRGDAERRAMLVVGVAGGIGSGKSTLCRLLAAKGASVVEADAIGHQALEEPAVRAALVRRFGPGVVGADGKIDRRRLGALVFADARALRFLSALTGPRIVAAIRRKLDLLAGSGFHGIAVLDAALLPEWEPRRFVDCLVFVRAESRLRCARARRSRALTRAEFERRDRAQAGLRVKMGGSDFVLYNDGDLEDLERKASELWRRLERWPRPRAQRMRVRARAKEE
jgi:dephospho-CoA kinase